MKNDESNSLLRPPSAVLPHRFPFLLVDRIASVEPGRRVVGVKQVLPDETYPMSLLPILLVEMMAQVGAAGILLGTTERQLPCFTGIERVHILQPVESGDSLIAAVTLDRSRGNIGWASGTVTAENKGLICTARFSYALLPYSIAGSPG